MHDPSPYQPPLPQDTSSNPYAHVGEPAVVKVFGILHLVFAGIGIILASWGLFIVIAGNPFLRLTETTPQMQAQIEMQSKLNPMGLATNSLALLVAVPMIIAGIQLLKKRKTALKWSNLYAFSSLGAKAINLALTLIFVMPIMQEATKAILPSSSGAGSAMGIAMIGGAIGSVAVSCIYPVLTLILLNRPNVKAWFSRLPG